MRTIIVGDVHGCLQELDELLERAAPGPEDHLVFAGDLLDRGPDPVGVVRRARHLAERTRVTLVRGNHEDRHGRFRRWEARRHAEGVHNPMGAPEELAYATEHLSEADVAFLDAAPLHLELPEHGAVVVHAGIPPSVDRLPSMGELATMNRDTRKRYEQVLRVRHVNARGWMVPLGQESSSTWYWAERYDGRHGHVYFGHQPWVDAHAPVRFPHATGVDLGACYGNRLAAVVLRPGEPPRHMTVHARATWARLRHGTTEA